VNTLALPAAPRPAKGSSVTRADKKLSTSEVAESQIKLTSGEVVPFAGTEWRLG